MGDKIKDKSIIDIDGSNNKYIILYVSVYMEGSI